MKFLENALEMYLFIYLYKQYKGIDVGTHRSPTYLYIVINCPSHDSGVSIAVKIRGTPTA